MSLARRLFTRNAARQTPRLPWLAVDELAFTDGCTRCDDCLRACPEQIIVRGQGGFPEIDFSKGGCTFCGNCADICKSAQASLFHVSRLPAEAFGFRVQISDACFPKQGIDCRSCGDACPEQAIRFRFNARRMAEPQLDADACTACGFCVGVCPASALTFEPLVLTEGVPA